MPWLPRTPRRAEDSYTGPGQEEDLAGTLGEPCRLGSLTPTVRDATFAFLLHHGLVHTRKASFTYVMIPVPICAHDPPVRIGTCVLTYVIGHAHSQSSSLTDTWTYVHISYIHITSHQTQAHTRMETHMHASHVMLTRASTYMCNPGTRSGCTHACNVHSRVPYAGTDLHFPDPLTCPDRSQQCHTSRNRVGGGPCVQCSLRLELKAGPRLLVHQR